MAPLPRPVLCLVTDRRLCRGRKLEQVVEAAVEGGCGMVQLREKDLPAGKLLDLAVRLRSITSGRALLIVNDRVDVALAAGADGVQLPEDGLAVDAARQVGGNMLVGRSVHSVAGGVQAVADGADFLVAGSVFATSVTSGGIAPRGLGAGRRPGGRRGRAGDRDRRHRRGQRRFGDEVWEPPAWRSSGRSARARAPKRRPAS